MSALWTGLGILSALAGLVAITFGIYLAFSNLDCSNQSAQTWMFILLIGGALLTLIGDTLLTIEAAKPSFSISRSSSNLF